MSICIKSIFTCLLVLLLSGCLAEKAAEHEPSSSSTVQTPPSIEIKSGKEAEPTGERVFVDRYIPFGELREFVVLDQPEDVEAFRNAVKNAEPDLFNGDRNQAPADFGIRLEIDGVEKQYLLWLGRTGRGNGLLEDLNDRDSRYVLDSTTRKDLYERISEMRYDSKQAEKNGDIVQTLGGVVHMDTWQAFIENVEHKQADSVQIVGYTIEGDPIFNNLSYDGTDFHYYYDGTYDKFGSFGKESSTCQKLVTEPMETRMGGPGIVYRLNGCEGSSQGISENFWFAIPEKTPSSNL